MKSNHYHVILILIVFLAVVLGFESINERNIIVDYYRVCNQQNINKEECKSWSVSEDTYFVNKYAQKVMFRGTYGLVPYSDCVVFDAENWSCNEGALNANDGIISESNTSPKIFSIEHLSRPQYWFYKFF
jgi:hypothetical protein